MAHQFKFTVDHMVGRREIELVVTYSFAPGRPATPPAYSHGGLPPEGPEIEIVSITHDGQPFAISDEETEALWEQACEHSADAWPEYLADVAAAETVLAGLNERIDAAPLAAVPVFAGIADLHSAIAKARGHE